MAIKASFKTSELSSSGLDKGILESSNKERKKKKTHQCQTKQQVDSAARTKGINMKQDA